MARPGQPRSSLVDPTATQGLIEAALDDDAGGGRPTETTRLLPVVEKANVHYRGISGPRFKVLFASILFGTTVAFFDSTLMASSHPVITSYFHASNAASWLSTVFYLTCTVIQPIYGRVSDTIGRRPVFLWAIAVFLASTAWCGAAGSMASFIAARAVCGAGAGGVISMTAIVTSDMVKIEFRGIYQSYFNMAFGLGNGLGAALGGLLCDRLGWRAAFYVQLPFIAVYGLLVFLTCPGDLGPNLARTQGQTLRQAFGTFDTAGAGALTLTMTCLILGVNLGGNVLTWTHPLVLTSLVLFVVAAVALYAVERRAVYPVLPLKFLSSVPTGTLMWSNFFGTIVTNTVLFNVPLYLQAVKQTSPTASGLYLISPLVGISVTAVLSGAYITLTRRLKPPMVLGSLCLLGGAVAVTSLSAHTPTWMVPLLIPLCSIGQGFWFPGVTIAVLALNAQHEQAVVTTTLGLIRYLGAILGVALSSWVFQNALLIALNRTVTAPDAAAKEHIIRTARESIRSIATLDPVHKAQVIEGYAQSLRLTFATGILLSLVSIALIWPVHIPRLQRQEDMDRRDAGVLVAEGAYEEPDLEDEYGEGAEGDGDEYDPDEYAILDSPATSIRRNMTASTRASRTSTSLAGSVPRGSLRDRRASFDTHY